MRRWAREGGPKLVGKVRLNLLTFAIGRSSVSFAFGDVSSDGYGGLTLPPKVVGKWEQRN